MSACESDSCRSHDPSSSILNFLRFVKMAKDVSKSWFHVSPWSCIFRFFLGPRDLGVLIVLQLGDDFLEWEWAKTFTPDDSSICDSILFSLRFKVVVNLS